MSGVAHPFSLCLLPSFRVLFSWFLACLPRKRGLGANADTPYSPQIEGLMDDVDFKAKVTRAEFEELCADLFERVPGPVQQALQSASMRLVSGCLEWAWAATGGDWMWEEGQ